MWSIQFWRTVLSWHMLSQENIFKKKDFVVTRSEPYSSAVSACSPSQSSYQEASSPSNSVARSSRNRVLIL